MSLDRRTRPAIPRDRFSLASPTHTEQMSGFVDGSTGHTIRSSSQDYINGWLDGNDARVMPKIDAANGVLA